MVGGGSGGGGVGWGDLVTYHTNGIQEGRGAVSNSGLTVS